ncbi:MAG: tripartite tricarboxylate transporter substrate binding protein [Rubrivivax sp.]|nr:tripartite tricarboxylate transporter substrate binding protein [Rubrivivax sp.]
MSITRTKLLPALAALGMALSLASGAAAQDRWPSKPIRLIVPSAPGASFDFTARLIATKLAEQLGQAVVVENIPGAGTTLGLVRLAKQPADGYTIGLGSDSNLVAGALIHKDVGYDPVRDFTPVARLVDTPYLYLVRADSPYRSFDEILAAARLKPGSISYGSAGVGSGPHLAGELLASQAKLTLLHVPYRGGGPAMSGLLSGDVGFSITTPAAAMPLIASGKIRALATTGAKRQRLLPDTPTVAESLPGHEVILWIGFVAPAGLPVAIQQRLAAEAKKVLAVPDVIERLSGAGLDVNFTGPEEAARSLAAELAQWGPVIKTLGIRVE